ncbi:hypothetical protein T440DRAFT_85213 [Plenodomus tracheiphilus IPT5]|uniref:Uncharacterized protein n=1 Tax=Plenodomus tracheiphilus IPT5 TaxID=1408161 RepID=A0A6A7B8R4_9PLEO|nr:hypothetical protein T440DRAFT_85213 [Plenodomus tracheiphilus IPT5]
MVADWLALVFAPRWLVHRTCRLHTILHNVQVYFRFVSISMRILRSVRGWWWWWWWWSNYLEVLAVTEVGPIRSRDGIHVMLHAHDFPNTSGAL